MRLRRKPWVSEAIHEFDDFVLTWERVDGGALRGKWRDAFGRAAPLYVELGTGKGDFITMAAAREPEANFIGIEAEESVLYTAAKKAGESELTNLRLLVFDAARVEEIFAPGEVDGIFINFCDPWPKKRHAKRRITNRSFLSRYRAIVKKGGRLVFKTDGEALFDFSLEEFAAAGLRIDSATRDLPADFPQNIETEYEKRFRAMGVRICRAEVIFP